MSPYIGCSACNLVKCGASLVVAFAKSVVLLISGFSARYQTLR